MTRRGRMVSEKKIMLAGILLGALMGGIWCAMPESRSAASVPTSRGALEVPARSWMKVTWTGLPGSETMNAMAHSPQIVGTGLLVLILGSIRPLSSFLGSGH